MASRVLALDAPLTSLADDQVLGFHEWCRLNRISERTRRRILASMTASLTCVVTFADGEITRMTVWSASGKADLDRGIKLARAAYESRRKRFPPAITAVHFEADGVALVPYTTEEIAEASGGKERKPQ
jgi:hypothetical protein